MKVHIICPHCGKTAMTENGAMRRAERVGAPIYCGRRCSGLARRRHKSKSQKIAEKKAYDVKRRILKRDEIKAKKSAYFQRTYDPTKAAVERKKRMPLHVEYCRQPKYKRWKSEYDRKYRALKLFGPFAEAYLTLIELDTHIAERITDYETRKENGTLGKIQQRRREDYADAGRYRYKTADGE